MKKILFACLFILSNLAVGAEPIKLFFNPEKEAKYEYRIEVMQDTKYSIMGRDIPQETRMDLTYVMEVKDKTAQEIQVQFTYGKSIFSDSVIMKTKMNETFDRMFDMLTGKSFTAIIAYDGSVKSITGLDVVAETILNEIALGDQMAAGMMEAQIKQLFSDAAMKKMLEQSLKMYPAKPVKVGDSWNVESTIPINVVKTNLKTKYTLKGIKKNVATVTVKSNIEVLPDADMAGKLTGTQTGTIVIDIRTGVPVATDVLQNMKGTIEAQDTNIKMEQVSKVKTTFKEIRK